MLRAQTSTTCTAGILSGSVHRTKS